MQNVKYIYIYIYVCVRVLGVKEIQRQREIDRYKGIYIRIQIEIDR